MEIVKSAGVPKDKPYYIILNQGLPNEQTFLIEPPESKEKGIINLFDPVREKKQQQFGFRPGLTQNGLYSHRRWLLEAGNFGYRK